MYHISDLRSYLRCKRKYFYNIDKTSEFQAYLRSDEQILDLLKEYLNIKEAYIGVVNEDAERFFKENDKYEWFIKPRFENNGLRINIPILHRKENKYDIYFIYYSTSINDIDYFNFRLNYQVLNDLGLNIDEIYITYLNENYIFKDKLDINELLIITNINKEKRIIDIIKNKEINYSEIIKEMSELNDENLISIKLNNCKEKKSCEYFSKCFLNNQDIEDDSILNLVSSQYKYQMYNEGIKYLKDVDLNKLEGNRCQYSQIMASRNGGLYVDKLALNNWLNRIEYPISYIDFEWDRYLVPSYNDMKPFDTLCFEYALYIQEEENGELKHHTYVGKGDCRKEFLLDLLDHLPSSGSILAYNAHGAEIMRIKELGNYYEVYQDKCNEIIKRFIDLEEPFSEGLIYDVAMAGNYTLKKLVSIVSDFSYEDLDIGNGMEAVYSWRDIDKGIAQDDFQIYENLKKYCSLDAYGLYLVYLWLVKMTNKL